LLFALWNRQARNSGGEPSALSKIATGAFLTAVANLVLVLLAILTVVTIAAVAGGTYLLAQRLAMPVRVLKNSLAELANGRLDYRIAETRKDEFGELYAEFDKTAAALERRYEQPPPPTTLSKHLTEGL
jgi:serine/threonine-protein kinase